MEQEYAGKIDNISLADFILLEVQHSVMVESNYLAKAEASAEYNSGNKLRLDIDLFEQYLGDEEPLNVPVIKYSTEEFAPALTGNVRVKTPNYYRGLELCGTGLADALEGCRFSHQWGPGSTMEVTPEDGSGKRLRWNPLFGQDQGRVK